MTNNEDQSRKQGRVTRIGTEFGFIESAGFPGESLYFKRTWFKGNPPLRQGEEVSFERKLYGGNAQAHYVRRIESAVMATKPLTERDLKPQSTYFLDWAYLGMPSALTELERAVLHEQWEFGNSPSDPARPFPILHSYLFHTFGRLVTEDKVALNVNAGLAAFNTGLVDERYEPVYALFERQNDPRSSWKLSGYCISGEGRGGQQLVRHFNPLPRRAHYFGEPTDLLYDVRAGKPEMPWRHVIVERINRWPAAFVQSRCPRGFTLRDTSAMSEPEKEEYFRALGAAIEDHGATYRDYMNRIKDALDLSIKRITWNFKTAIPQYYPRVKAMTLLLPLCLVSDDCVDLALAVEKTPSGNYLGHTIFTLDVAYRNARLVCRPDSDWLLPQRISEEAPEDEGE
jgi:hypothetical protein